MALAVVMLMTALPMNALAACMHSYIRAYTCENENMHSYVSQCRKCGDIRMGWGYSDWEDHVFDANGVCYYCGYQKECSHPSVHKVANYENANMHSSYSVCDVCGATVMGPGYSGWEDHTWGANDTCIWCGYRRECPHSSATATYFPYSASQHKMSLTCNTCGVTYYTWPESHSWEYGMWTAVSDTQHERSVSCVCGESRTETADHSFSGDVCTACGFVRQTQPAVTASVTLYASGPSGDLGPAGGEISSETVPASYTVYAEAEGCTVTGIAYDYDGWMQYSAGSSVTITAYDESDFATTIFTAYTDVPGVTATFAVNFKFVRHASAYIMWNTSEDAVIRSIVGNGMVQYLTYPMTIPNSYEVQGNLTDEQEAEIQALIGVRDGKTYTVNYTRTVWVYTPAEYSPTGQRIDRGSYDGNDSAAIEECIRTWGWTAATCEAIRQAANSSLAFTTALEADCLASWVNTTNGATLHSQAFGTDAVITPSHSAVVSVSYSDWSGAGGYVYESLAYSGDRSGTSTAQTYSQTYTVRSKPLRVIFYCHPVVTSGGITVRAVDGDTNDIIPTATVSCGSRSGSNPSTFTGVSLGTHTCSASAPGYSSASAAVTVTSSEPSKTVTLKLYRQVGTVTVTVRDAETRAVIPCASVSGGGTSVSTDSSGVAVFPNLPFGSYTFTASADGYYPGSASAVISSTAKDTSVTIYLDPMPKSGTITVTVRDADTGAAIPNASVWSNALSGTTDSWGEVTFSGIPFGDYDFTAESDGYYPGSGSATISVDTVAASTTIWLTPLPTSGTLTVIVTDDVTGKAISAASVTGAGRSGTTNSRGQCVFYDVPFGYYTIDASKTGYIPGSGSIVIDSVSATLEIRLIPLPTSGTINVTVLDLDTHAAIRDADVYSSTVSGTTNTSGKIRFTNLPFGSYTFRAAAAKYIPASGTASISAYSPEASVVIYLKKMHFDLSVRGELNGTVYKGSTIMVSAHAGNIVGEDLTPDNPATVKMTAKNAAGTVFNTQTKSVIIPAGESNLVWFTLTVPDTDRLEIDFTVSPPEGEDAVPSNNLDHLSIPVYDLPARNCKDAEMTDTAPASYYYSVYAGLSAPARSWDVWEWEDGGFVHKTYTAHLDITAYVLPDETAGTRDSSGGNWMTRSGYGIRTEVSVSTDTESDAIAGNAKVDVFFPEHVYSEEEKKSDRLERVGDHYEFRVLTTSVGNRRMHTVPLWYPDGTYALKYYVYDVWCPAGMLSGCANASLEIRGDMYDDLYAN